MFLINSRHPLVCAPRTWLPKHGAPFSRSYGGILPSSFNTVLSSALVYSTSPPVSVWGTVYTLGLFPGTPSLPGQSDKPGQYTAFVTTSRLRNINLIPIDYGFRPRLRGRLTLRGLALRRNPWAFGESVSHTLYRYSCQHSHFRYLQRPSRDTFTGLRNAPLPVQRTDGRSQRFRFAVAAASRDPATSSKSPDTPIASLPNALRRYSPGPSNSAPIRASRRSTRAPS